MVGTSQSRQSVGVRVLKHTNACTAAASETSCSVFLLNRKSTRNLRSSPNMKVGRRSQIIKSWAKLREPSVSSSSIVLWPRIEPVYRLTIISPAKKGWSSVGKILGSRWRPNPRRNEEKKLRNQPISRRPVVLLLTRADGTGVSVLRCTNSDDVHKLKVLWYSLAVPCFGMKSFSCGD